jgi:hypothetical protein
MAASAGELRVVRWFGRALTVASAWPVWYAFYGKSQFDWEALLFGLPALVAGLLTWRWAGYRLRNSVAEAATPDDAARALLETTVATRIAERLDNAQSNIGAAALAGVIGGTALFAALSLRVLTASGGGPPEAAVLLALALGLMTLGWRATKGPVAAAVIAALAGAAFVGKPWYAPISRWYDGALHAMSPSSETHLYYVIPGVGLIGLSIVMLSTITVGKPAATLPVVAEAIELPRPEPPRPEPPQPPSK